MGDRQQDVRRFAGRVCHGGGLHCPSVGDFSKVELDFRAGAGWRVCPKFEELCIRPPEIRLSKSSTVQDPEDAALRLPLPGEGCCP